MISPRSRLYPLPRSLPRARGGAGFTGMKPDEWLNLQLHRPQSSEGAVLGSMLCGHHMKILNHFWTRAPHIHVALGPADYVTSPGYGLTKQWTSVMEERHSAGNIAHSRSACGTTIFPVCKSKPQISSLPLPSPSASHLLPVQTITRSSH